MKKLACIVGRHRWTTQTEQGEEYKVCSACAKMRIPRNPWGGSERSYGDDLIPPSAGQDSGVAGGL